MGNPTSLGWESMFRRLTHAATLFKCKEASLPCSYLGLRIGGNMKRVSSWDFLFEIFEKRLASWIANTLSIGGRVTLIKAVLESFPTYYLSLFAAPLKVVDGLESIMRRFLWGGNSDTRKINWVAWDTVASPLKAGGLGISKLKDTNTALLSKWIWRYRLEADGLWRKVIDSIHGSRRGWNFVPVNRSLSSVWKTIVTHVDRVKVNNRKLKDLFKGVCGRGDTIRFWLDPWIDNWCLKDRFPLLFKLERDKRCVIKERLCSEYKKFVGDPVWFSTPMSPDMLTEWLSFRDIMDDIRISEADDRLIFLGDKQEVFSVKGVKKFIQNGVDYSGRYAFKWAPSIPKNVIFSCGVQPSIAYLLTWHFRYEIATLDRLCVFYAVHVMRPLSIFYASVPFRILFGTALEDGARLGILCFIL